MNVRLLELAASEVERGCPTCFIHPDGHRAATLVLLTIDEYDRIHSWVPDSHSHGPHCHVEPDPVDAPLPFDPDWRVAPGETLREIIEERPATRGRLTNSLGAGLLQAILDGGPITPAVAAAIADATGTSAPFWINLEAAYRRPVYAPRRRLG